jgi:hypothetical protein
MSSSGDQLRVEQGHSAAISRDPAPLASELSLLRFGRQFAHHRGSFRACASSVFAAVACRWMDRGELSGFRVNCHLTH